MIRRKATALVVGALLLTGACTTYQIPYDPGTTLALTPGSAVAASPVVTTTTVLATSATAIAPAPAPAPVTTVRPAAPPAPVRPGTVAPPPTAPPRVFIGASSAVAALVAPAVVDIEGVLGVQHSFGTGMVLTTSGQVLTNNHVIRGARSITATVVATGRIFTARVVGVDATADVALLQLQSPVGLTGITVGGTAPVIPGDPISAIGAAGGRGGGPTVMTGSVIATGQALVAADANGGVEHLTNLIEISASPQPGDSGGPLANGAGQIIGMVVASADGAGYAIPINTVISVAQLIQAGPAGTSP